MGDQGPLSDRIQELIRAGRLPDRLPDRIWGGPSKGAACAICGEPVDEVGFELEFARTGGEPGPEEHEVHVSCLTAWELEIRNREPGGDPGRVALPDPVDGGKIAGHGDGGGSERGPGG